MPADGKAWPPLPYKGLGYYTAADAPLFAGRDDDIDRCAGLLAEWRSRLLLLHGSTGCGKSSFLRAGLIPHLESAGAGIAFARGPGADDAPVLFVRSTAEPLATLADAVHRFASREVVLQTPAGPRALDLRSALPDQSASEFRRAHGEDPDGLLAILEQLSRIVPETLVLIIDQAEEVLTVDPAATGERHRRLFFDFLADFVQAQFDMKLLVALRTEYFGRFVSRARRDLRAAAISEYFLDELDDAQIVEAVLRPTSTEAVADRPSPRSVYRFEFEPGVAESIVEELGRTGGRLPALQIVCTSLHDIARARAEPWRITAADLEAVGGVEGATERFLDQRLFDCGLAARLPPVQCQREVSAWKEALHGLARTQPDGTVTTELKRADALREALKGSRLDFDRTVGTLASDDVRLLRKVDVVDSRSGALVTCYGLGHDTLGLVLRNWKVRHDRDRELSLGLGDAGDDETEPATTVKDIALCLSGGGYRAMLFHLGALWRLNELGYLPRIARVSGVSSGAMLAAALGLKWKSLAFDADGVARNFEAAVAKPVRGLAAETLDVQSVLTGLLGELPAATSGAQSLARRLRASLFGDATLQDLPDDPVFVFTAVNVQCPSLFRFTRRYLGNREIGYVRDPAIGIADAVAASAAMPPALSPLVLRFPADAWTTIGRQGHDERLRTQVSLMDGTLQDHLGLDAAWNRHRTILVSDGGGQTAIQPEVDTNWIRQATRLIDLQAARLKDLREKQIAESFRSGQKQGAYWSMRVDRPEHEPAPDHAAGLARDLDLAEVPTRFSALDGELQERLVNHGYRRCDAAMRGQMRESGAPAQLPYPARDR